MLNFYCHLYTDPFHAYRINYREMISFNIDSQSCGLLFSVYCRGEKGSVFSTSCLPQQDAFSTCSYTGPFLDPDWVTFAGNVGFEICRISSTWAFILETVKASGFILLLGFGGFICYKLYNCYVDHYCHQKNPSPKNYTFKNSKKEEVDVDNIDSDDESIKAFYFGPSSLVQDDQRNGSFSASEILNLTNILKSNFCSSRVNSKEIRKNKDILNDKQWDTSCIKPDKKAWFFEKDSKNSEAMTVQYQAQDFHLPRDTSFDSTYSDISLDLSFTEPRPNNSARDFEKLQEEIENLKTNCLMMGEEFESIKCNRNLPGMSSLLKAQFPNDDCVSSLAESECNYSFKHGKANKCFEDLYSFTTIYSTTSSDLSDSSISAGDISQKTTFNSKTILREDVSSNSATEQESDFTTDLNKDAIRTQSTKFSSIHDASIDSVSSGSFDNIGSNDLSWSYNENEVVASLEWDENDMKSLDNCENNGAWLKEETLQDTLLNYNINDFREDIVYPMHCTETQPVVGTPSTDDKTSFLNIISPTESGYAEFDELSENSYNGNPHKHQSKFSEELDPCDQLPTAHDVEKLINSSDVFPSYFNIGNKVDILKYAVQEYNYKTKHAENALQAYSMLSSFLQYKSIRQIKKDENSCIRAVLFQVLSQGISIPDGKVIFQYLTEDLNRNNAGWITNWKFSNNEFYCNKNILEDVWLCLQSLDNMVMHLSTCQQREEILVSTLNSNPVLDSHLIEAVKLHMLQKAMELYRAKLSNKMIPTFASLMFTSNVVPESSNFRENYLHKIGTTDMNNELQMNLLGYTFGVAIKVIRPSAHGSSGFLKTFCDWSEKPQSEICLLTDECHFNILL